VILTGRETTEETLYSIKEQLCQIPSNGFSYVVLKYFTEQEFHILPQIQMNYLGEFDHNAGQEEEFFTSQSIENTYDMDENSPCMTKLAITGSILQNCLSLSVEYDQMEYHQETMERFMQLYGQALSETADFVLEKNEKVFTPSDFGCAGMDRKDFQRICTLAGKEKEIEVIYPASEMQKGMLLLSQFYREQSYYHEQMMLVLPFQVKEDEFKLRLEEISQNYQVLRSIFAHQNMRQVYQIVLKNSGIDYRYQDIRNLGKDWEPGKELSRILRTYLEGYMKADRFQGFDAEKEVMFRCRLFRLTNEAYAVLFSFSHVILDKWSMDILLNQIFGNEKEKIRDCYGDYVHWLKVQNRTNVWGVRYQISDEWAFKWKSRLSKPHMDARRGDSGKYKTAVPGQKCNSQHCNAVRMGKNIDEGTGD